MISCSKSAFCAYSLRHAAQAPREGLVVGSISASVVVVGIHMAERVAANGKSGSAHGHQGNFHLVLVVLVVLLLLDQVFFDQAGGIDTMKAAVIAQDRRSRLLLVLVVFQNLSAFHCFEQLFLKRGSSVLCRGELLLLL